MLPILNWNCPHPWEQSPWKPAAQKVPTKNKAELPVNEPRGQNGKW